MSKTKQNRTSADTKRRSLVLRNLRENAMYVVFLAAAAVSILAVLLICLFLFSNAIPTIAQIGPLQFLSGLKWVPNSDVYGILPMIVGSIYVTAGACLIGVPIGVLAAVFMARFCPASLYKILQPAVSLMAGIPSIVYGFFGMVVLVPFIHNTLGGNGKSLATASILLGIMILPTIISVSESALRSVDNSYYEGSLALGATKECSIFYVLLPAAKSGIFASIVLGLGRAIGETMAVVMVAGNQNLIPSSITQGVRTMTANIVLEMGEAADLHRQALIATAAVLFVFILLINLSFSAIRVHMEGKVK
ncbi:phosphate transport system permease protein [Actinomycetota bacterium]|nr:phosphate transport system permease protein [Actinomycetota bacterium]